MQGDALGTGLEDLTGGELLEHVGSVARQQREAEVELLRAAAQHAVVNSPETVAARWDVAQGGEQALRLGGDGTPEVAEFAPAELGVRAGLSPYGGRQLVADALDLKHRFPGLWARVEALEVRASYARYVARTSRDLSRQQALLVDARVTEAADGRVSWSRFTELVAAAVVAADPEGAREREQDEARRQYARATRSDGNGMRGFYVRAGCGVIARLEASVGRIAQILADLGDPDPVDVRRVKAVLVLAHPGRAAELLAAYTAWRDRPEGEEPLPDPEEGDEDPPARGAAAGPAAPFQRTGGKPSVTWADLLPTVVLYVHCYAGSPGRPESGGVVRVEGEGPVSEYWLRDQLGPWASFRVQPVLDPTGQAPVDAYEIPDRHREAVRVLTPADVFPFASSVSRDSDIDHTIPYARHDSPGQSRVGNYGPLTRAHHRLKTHAGWQVRQPFPGIYLWRDPHGRYYLVDHTGTRELGPERRGRDPG